MRKFFPLLWLGLALVACQKEETPALPFLGEHQVKSPGDTVYYQSPAFRFTDQDSVLVTEADFAGKIFVTDFFFTTCPDICPKMKQQMIRVYDAYEGNDTVKILSHTLFPEVDSVAVLHSYAAKLGIESSRWHMVTGDQDTIFSMAHSYMIAAMKDEKAAGGILHSGAFILLDGQRHIRGYYDGTNAEEVDRLIKDIRTLLHERTAR